MATPTGPDPKSVRRSKSIIYPMQIAKSGTFLLKENAHRSNIFFLLDFLRGAKFWEPRYGVDLDVLEQAGAELNELLPIVTMQLRANIQEFVPRVGIDAIVITRKLQKATRTLRFDVLFRTLTSQQVIRETFDEALVWQAVQPNEVIRGVTVRQELSILWEALAAPAVSPFLALGRKANEASGYHSHAPQTLDDAPSATDTVLFTMDQATAGVTSSGGGPGVVAQSRQYAEQSVKSSRHLGAFGFYYRAIAVLDSASSLNNLQQCNLGPAVPVQLSAVVRNNIYFRVLSSGAAGSRTPGTIECVVRDGASGIPITEAFDTLLSLVDIPRTLEIVVVAGFIKFFIDGIEKFSSALDIPPDTNTGDNVDQVIGEQIFGDDPPGGSAFFVALGFFGAADGLLTYGIRAGGAELKVLENSFSYIDVPEVPTP